MAGIEINEAALRADVEKYLTTYARTLADSAAEEFTQAAKDVISSVYYGGYSQKYYNRTDDLRNNSYKKYKKNNGSTFYGGVKITSEAMSDYTNIWGGKQSTTSADTVLSWAWGEGYHGYLGGDPSNRIQTFPPISALEMEAGMLIPSLQSKANSVAKSQGYSVLQF